MITDVWVYMFIFGVYPLLISIISTTLLVHNLLFDSSYPVMCVWHRNSIINLIQTITFSSIIIDCFCRYLDNQDDIADREKVLDVFRPFFILCILILTMVSQTNLRLILLLDILCPSQKLEDMVLHFIIRNYIVHYAFDW